MIWILLIVLFVGFALSVYFGGKGSMRNVRGYDTDTERIVLPPEPMYRDPRGGEWKPLHAEEDDTP